MSICACAAAAAPDPVKAAALNAFIDTLNLNVDMDERRGHLILCLHKAQHIFGYLPVEVQRLVADRLRLQMADVYGVISFYSYFTDKPVGRNKVAVCMGTACFVRGADKLMHACKEELKVEENGTTDDMRATLIGLRCVGACSLAPVVMVNDKVYGGVSAKQIPKILSECK